MGRSALDFLGGMQPISLTQFSRHPGCDDPAAFADFAGARFIQLYLYAHRVQLWPARAELEHIKSGDQRVAAAALSLGQELAGNACVPFSMIGDLERTVRAVTAVDYIERLVAATYESAI